MNPGGCDGRPSRQAHLVGSLGLESAEAAFVAAAEALGPCCPRLPDGEPGERSQWIRWQRAAFEGCAALDRVASLDRKGFRDGIDRPVFGIRDGFDPGGIDFGELGYGRAAVQSFAVFSRLRDEGRIAEGCRFMVAVPTTVALVGNFVRPEDQLALEPVVEAALFRDLERIGAEIPADSLSVQLDVCIEVVGADGGCFLFYDDPLDGALERIARFGKRVGADAEFGIHLCYGDPGHKHLVEPEDLGTCVAFANGIVRRVPRRVDFVHMPVPRGRSDEAYFAPLEGLALPAATRLVLGLVHYTDGVAGSRIRMAAADRFVEAYDVATECGFGRRDPATIPLLLRMHRELCS